MNYTDNTAQNHTHCRYAISDDISLEYGGTILFASAIVFCICLAKLSKHYLTPVLHMAIFLIPFPVFIVFGYITFLSVYDDTTSILYTHTFVYGVTCIVYILLSVLYVNASESMHRKEVGFFFIFIIWVYVVIIDSVFYDTCCNVVWVIVYVFLFLIVVFYNICSVSSNRHVNTNNINE